MGMKELKKDKNGLNEKLRTLIETCGLSRYEIAKLSGVSEAMLSRYVRRMRALNTVSAERILEALKMEIIIRKRKGGKK